MKITQMPKQIKLVLIALLPFALPIYSTTVLNMMAMALQRL